MTVARDDGSIVIVSALAGSELTALRRSRPDLRLVWVDPERPASSHLEALAHLDARIYADDASRRCLEREFVLKAEPLANLAVPGGERLPAPRTRPRSARRRRRGPVVFCPSNDTHVKMFDPIARLLPGSRFLVADQRPEEQAAQTLEALSLPYVSGDAGDLARMLPSAIVVGNDWYETTHELSRAVRPLGVPTLCLQEGCLDFSREKRMQHCDYPLIQGMIVLDHLDQRLYIATGNPRFDGLRPAPLPSTPQIMLNCNFTYGVHEEVRDTWVNAAVSACRKLDLDCFVSQHPRDTGRFPGVDVRRSGATVVHDHVRQASAVVTRFSTLVYEALLLGRPVVYYNPHGEDMRLFNEDRTGALLMAEDDESLVRSLRAAVSPPSPERRAATELFLDLHCGPRDGRAANRCAAAIRAVAARGDVAGTPSIRQRLHAVSMLLR